MAENPPTDGEIRVLVKHGGERHLTLQPIDQDSEEIGHSHRSRLYEIAETLQYDARADCWVSLTYKALGARYKGKEDSTINSGR